MVKKIATSIITVAVLMGSLVACGGSDSEVAELREELEETKAQLPEQEATAVETASSQPIPIPDQIPFGSDRDASESLKEIADDADIIVGLIGKQIAFTSDRDGEEEIFVMDADRSYVRQLTTNDVGDYDPAWSPDGKQIAFTSDRDGHWDVLVMDADGSNVRQLTTNDDGDGDPAWSPDGKQITFTSDRDGDLEVFVMDADGSNVISTTQKGKAPTFKP